MHLLPALGYTLLRRGFLSGMSSRDFKGFPSLQEVECWAGVLEAEVKLLSLRLFRESDTFVLSSLNILTNNCVTFGDYSSCVIDSSDTHKSRLSVLIVDLEEGENRRYGCLASTISAIGQPETDTWSVLVSRKSKYDHLKCCYVVVILLLFCF